MFGTHNMSSSFSLTHVAEVKTLRVEIRQMQRELGRLKDLTRNIHMTQSAQYSKRQSKKIARKDMASQTEDAKNQMMLDYVDYDCDYECV